MDYELAKKLKDAGFDQNLNGGISKSYPIPNPTDDYDIKGDEMIYFPTLSELVEMCGEDFYDLQKDEDTWIACYKTDTPKERLFTDVYGKTPEIAVANLWLELNKAVANLWLELNKNEG